MDQFAGSHPRLFISFRLDIEQIGQPTSGTTDAMQISATNLVNIDYLSSSTSSLSETSGLQVLPPEPVSRKPTVVHTAEDPQATAQTSDGLHGKGQSKSAVLLHNRY